MLNINTQLIWHGHRVKASIIARVKRNLKEAGKSYFIELRSQINTWGSVSVGGNLRKMVQTSSPGSPPMRQTSELLNATKFHTDQVGQDTFIAEISNEAAHAITLELGGITQIGNNRPHTQYRLVNSPKNVGYIAPRPVWIPTFNRMINLILQILMRK